MATVPQVSGRRGSLRFLALIVGLTGGLSAGCVTVSFHRTQEQPKTDLPCRLGVRWENEVGYAPDPNRGGQLTPGLVGRVYLFGQNVASPLEGDGSLHVELADASQNPPKVLEQWNIDAEKLKLFQRKDAIGQGYSVFLPWATYRPDLTSVVIKTAYKARQGHPLYAAPTTVNFDHGGMPGGMGLSRSLAPATTPMPSIPSMPSMPSPRPTLPMPTPVLPQR